MHKSSTNCQLDMLKNSLVARLNSKSCRNENVCCGSRLNILHTCSYNPAYSSYSSHVGCSGGRTPLKCLVEWATMSRKWRPYAPNANFLDPIILLHDLVCRRWDESTTEFVRLAINQISKDVFIVSTGLLCCPSPSISQITLRALHPVINT